MDISADGLINQSAHWTDAHVHLCALMYSNNTVLLLNLQPTASQAC